MILHKKHSFISFEGNIHISESIPVQAGSKLTQDSLLKKQECNDIHTLKDHGFYISE